MHYQLILKQKNGSKEVRCLEPADCNGAEHLNGRGNNSDVNHIDLRDLTKFLSCSTIQMIKCMNDTDVLVTHEPPMMILDKSNGTHWGNLPLRNKVMQIKLQLHLFGHAHEAYGRERHANTIYSNAVVLDDQYRMCNKPQLHIL